MGKEWRKKKPLERFADSDGARVINCSAVVRPPWKWICPLCDAHFLYTATHPRFNRVTFGKQKHKPVVRPPGGQWWTDCRWISDRGMIYAETIRRFLNYGT